MPGFDCSFRYLLQVAHYCNGGTSHIEVGAKFFNTQFTRDWTSKADQEVQTMVISSTVVREVQVRIDSSLHSLVKLRSGTLTYN